MFKANFDSEEFLFFFFALLIVDLKPKSSYEKQLTIVELRLCSGWDFMVVALIVLL